MAMLKFNGTTITPDPSEMEVTLQDITTADSGRSDDGTAHVFVVRHNVRTIKLGWNNIEKAEALAIIQALQSGSDSKIATVIYEGDPLMSSNNTRTGTFYYGDISSALQQVWVAGKRRYSKLSFNLIEV